MFSMFSSTPTERTTDPVLLKQKAIEFLDKNYTRLKPGETRGEYFYMLEPNSINGMKKVQCRSNFETYQDSKGVMLPMRDRTCNTTVTYTDKNGNAIDKNEIQYIDRDNDRNNVDTAMWYRNNILMGNSASTAVLGGKSRRKYKKSKRSKRSNRKSFR